MPCPVFSRLRRAYLLLLPPSLQPAHIAERRLCQGDTGPLQRMRSSNAGAGAIWVSLNGAIPEMSDLRRRARDLSGDVPEASLPFSAPDLRFRIDASPGVGNACPRHFFPLLELMRRS